MIGGFVKFVSSKGWLCIRLHCSINMCFKFLTAGGTLWWKELNVRDLSAFVYVQGKVDPWQRPFYNVFWVPFCFEALFEFQTIIFKCFFWRVSSKQSYCLTLMKPYFTLSGWCWRLKCNNCPKCNKVLNVIIFGPKCNKPPMQLFNSAGVFLL